MKSLLFMLIFSLFFNSCGESLCTESGTEEMGIGEISKMTKYSSSSRHVITENNCHLINEWLNRKSISHFIKKHISLDSGISSINEKTLNNNTFIP